MVLEHSNKLVLAVHAYQRSQWFIMCCEIGKQIYDEVTLPVKEMLKIDEYKDTNGPDHSWNSLKQGFQNICTTLGSSCNMSECPTGKEKLDLRVKLKIPWSDSFLRWSSTEMMMFPQRHKVWWFKHQKPTWGVRVDPKRAGGSTSLKTISDQHVIKRNALYKKSKWPSLGKEEKWRRWRWASSSAQAKKVDLSVT